MSNFSLRPGERRASSSLDSVPAGNEKKSVVLIQEGAEVKNIPTLPDAEHSTTHEDVNITPSYIRFTGASEGITCRQRITIKNTGRRPAFVRIREPNSIAFQIKALKRGVMLNPGLSVSTVVTYSFRRPSLLHAMIPIEINGKIIDYRVVCTLATELISVEPKSIDFGTIDIGFSSGLKIITLTNEGGQSTRFSVDLGKNDLEITVKPIRGIVKPNKQVNLRVELIGMNEGVFYSEFWIKSVPNIRIPLKVNVIIPRLVVYHPNTTGDFTLIDFPPTIENTQRYETFVLRNLSSQVASYVVLGEIGNDVICIRDIDRKEHPVYDAFEIRPIQGRMDPFEGIIFEVGFTPTSKLMRWRQDMKQQQATDRQIDRESPENDFMAFVRIVRVHVTETEDILRIDPGKDLPTDDATVQSQVLHDKAIMDVTSSSSSCVSSSDSGVHDTVRLCLHGEVEVARLNFQPDMLHFGDICVGETSQRVVRISNPLKFAPIIFQFVRNASASCYPESMELKSEGSHEVVVKVKGKESVSSPFKLIFDVIVYSYDSTMKRCLKKVKIGSYSVQCTVNVILIPGFPWQRSAKNKLLRIYRCPPVRTTITEQFPYSFTLNYSEAFSPKVAAFKAAQRKYWSNYLRTVSQARKINEKDLIEESIDDEIITKILRTPKWRYKELQQIVQCESLTVDKSLVSKTKAEVLIPLSPLQIYNVHIFPTMFTFGMVALKSQSYRQLIVENRNDFPVMIRLISLSSRCIHFPEGNLIILPAGSIITRLIEFRADHIGKFNGYIDYVINDNHSFELSITADVVNKQLSLDIREVVIGSDYLSEELYHPMDAFIQIKNKLDAKTYFRWEIPATCGFYVEPTFGSVRGNGMLYVYVHYKSDASKSNYTELIIKCESGTYITVRLNIPLLTPKVNFINEIINLGEIPLNLPTRAIAVLRSLEFTDVVYEVDSTSLVHGCVVYPLRGVISPRGIAILDIQLTFDVCFQFSTVVRIVVQKCLHLQLKIVGRVSFPRLKLFPSSIDAKRISADAYQSYLITATNVGTTNLKLNFLLEEYPEFRISLSPSRRYPDIIKRFSLVCLYLARDKILSHDTFTGTYTLTGNKGTMIAPGNSQNFYLHFEPVDLASYAFYLPIVINDIVGPALVGNPNSLNPLEYIKQYEQFYVGLSGFTMEQVPSKFATISIDCTIAGHVVYFSKLLFQFNVSTNEVQEELIVENRESPVETSVLIQFDSFQAVDCPFSIQWSKGVQPIMSSNFMECTLQTGEKTVFLLQFQPKERGSYSLEAPIFVRGKLDDKVFNKLCLDGVYPVSLIDVENSEIYFTPVPLCTLIEETLWLRVKHFENAVVITAKILSPEYNSGDYRHDVLSVQFPSGNVVPATQYTELEVKLIFKSDVPVAFRLTIEFCDESGFAVCPMKVCAIADNNLLTTHAHMRKSIEDYQRSRNFESRASYFSITSESGSDDEDYDEAQHQNYHPRKQRQGSVPRISVVTYFGRRSRASLGKVIESKLKIPSAKDMHGDSEGDGANYDNIQVDPESMEHELDRDDAECSKDSLPKIRKLSGKLLYPFYPVSERNDDYEIHMNQTTKAAEEWLYSGPFKFGFYPNIINGLTASLSNLCAKKRQSNNIKGKNHSFGWSFVDVLESLVGPQIYDYIGKSEPLSENNAERIDYVLRLYDRILDFLLNHGAYLPHVSSQFLLSYNDYTVITDPLQNNMQNKTALEVHSASCEKMSQLVFEARSKQCWLDVILQTYKCFVLARVSMIKFGREFPSFSLLCTRRSTMQRESVQSSILSIPKQYDFYDRAIHSIVQLTKDSEMFGNHSSEESFLLSWLSYHYEEERVKEWMIDRRLILNPHETKNVAHARVIDNFDEDLSDSLVFIAVTAAYCPFLIEEHFSNIYISPRSHEEVLHNAICIVNAWRKIRLGFVVSPMEIVYPNSVQMLMLVFHLFELLPTYIPRAKIKFSCTLTETITRQISFTNPTNFAVGYLLLFIGNDSGFFTIVNSQSVLQLNGHDSALVRIQFHARKIRKLRAYLVFCGSAIGPHFGRNQTFILEGRADSLQTTNEYVIRSKLYQVVDKTLSIDVPYRDSAEYEISMSEQQPSKPSGLKMTRWSELSTRKIPRRLYLNQKSIIVTEDTRQGHLSITVACIVPLNRIFWLVFQSKLGDFIIQITSQWQPSLTDHLVTEWSSPTSECICSDVRGDNNTVCPYNVNILIPSRNTQLWRCVATMFQKTLDSKERIFWSRYLDTYIGLRLIRWLMGDNTDSAALEFAHIFDTTITYNVTISDKSNSLVVPDTFIIDDVRPSNKDIPMTVHVLPSTPQLYETTLSLSSADNKELRVYTISFLRV